MNYPREAKIYEEAIEKDIMSPIILPVNPDDYEKSGGMRAGLIKAETGLPKWKTEGKSIEFPFIVTEEDWSEDKRDGALYASMRKFALQPKLDAIGVPLETVDGKLTFDDEACAGKEVLVLYQMQRDMRSVEEGGTGRSYPKAVEFYPVGTSEESLGI